MQKVLGMTNILSQQMVTGWESTVEWSIDVGQEYCNYMGKRLAGGAIEMK